MGGTLSAVLSATNLSPSGRNEWRGNSPFRPGADSKSFTLTASDDEHGAWHDFVANESGSLYQLAERLNIALPDRAPATVTKRAYTGGLEEYGNAHGAPLEAWQRAGWKEVNHQKRAALEIPTSSGNRWRFIDGLKPRFIHEAGYAPCWYGLRDAPQIAQDAGLPIVLCNGEPSVVSAQWWGIPAACITSSGERVIKGKLLAEIQQVWGTKRLVIALDCDDKGRDAAIELAKSLQDAGFSTAIVDLGLTDGGDLADFCALYQADAVTALMERAKFTVPTAEQRMLDSVAAIGANIQRLTLALKSARLSEKPVQNMINDLQAQLDAAKLGVPSQIVTPGGVVADMMAIRYQKAKENRGRMIGLPTSIMVIDRLTKGLRNGLSIFLGENGAGKSTLMATLTGNLVRGGYRGLILTTEMNNDDWTMRLQAYLMGVTTDQLEDGSLGDEYNAKNEGACGLIEANLDYMERNVSTVDMLRHAIEKERAKRDYDFVVVDSIKELIGASENISMAYGQGLSALSNLAMEMKMPFLCTAHAKRIDSIRKTRRLTIADAFGGVSVEATAASFWALYNPTSLLKKGMISEADLDYPEGMIELANLKFRERSQIEGVRIPLQFVGGCGMYDLPEKRR